MTTYALTDSRTMLRRNLRRMRRNPGLTLFVAGIPIVILLLFVYVFGGTLGAGLPGGGGRSAYADYLTPGILLFTIVGGAQLTAIAVAMDMTEGIVARFKTMAVWRGAVLAGHVLGSVIQTSLAIVLVVAVALAVGFRPDASALEWLAAAGLMVFLTFGLTWVCVALGLAAKTVESASNTPMFLMLLPFLGSGFVPTDSMPGGLRWFADHQPFTPINEALRGLLLGTPIGSDGVVALVWCALITAGGYAWSRALYDRPPRGA
jgi:ABC-2 type transport system permease protein